MLGSRARSRLTDKKQELPGWSAGAPDKRRIGHGGVSWALPDELDRRKQPQDGSPESRAKVATFKRISLLAPMQEPEDALITGGTRSLARRLLGLNLGRIRKSSATQAAATPRTRVA